MEATEDGNLMLNGKLIHIFGSRDPADLDWKSVGAEYVIDSTGKFNTLEKCQPHLDNGAKKVLITAPSGKSTYAPYYQPFLKMRHRQRHRQRHRHRHRQRL